MMQTALTFGRTAATNQYFLGFSSNYQSLQASLTKRFSHGLTFSSAFTWGKGLNYNSDDDGGLHSSSTGAGTTVLPDFDRKLNLRAELHLRVALRPWTSSPQLGHRRMPFVGGWKFVRDHLWSPDCL